MLHAAELKITCCAFVAGSEICVFPRISCTRAHMMMLEEKFLISTVKSILLFHVVCFFAVFALPFSLAGR